MGERVASFIMSLTRWWILSLILNIQTSLSSLNPTVFLIFILICIFSESTLLILSDISFTSFTLAVLKLTWCRVSFINCFASGSRCFISYRKLKSVSCRSRITFIFFSASCGGFCCLSSFNLALRFLALVLNLWCSRLVSFSTLLSFFRPVLIRNFSRILARLSYSVSDSETLESEYFVSSGMSPRRSRALFLISSSASYIFSSILFFISGEMLFFHLRFSRILIIKNSASPCKLSIGSGHC